MVGHLRMGMVVWVMVVRPHLMRMPVKMPVVTGFGVRWRRVVGPRRHTTPHAKK